jgi:hypothetical protein
MQAAEDRVRHDSARLGQRFRLAWNALLDALVRSCMIEVGDVFLDDAVKMALAEEERMACLSGCGVRAGIVSQKGFGGTFQNGCSYCAVQHPF